MNGIYASHVLRHTIDLRIRKLNIIRSQNNKTYDKGDFKPPSGMKSPFFYPQITYHKRGICILKAIIMLS